MSDRLKRWIVRAGAGLTWLVARVERRDVVILSGLLLVIGGLWGVSRPAALVVPGAVLLWLSLPMRPPFVAPKGK